MAGYSQDDIEEMKIRDGLTLHEHRKTILREYCSDNDGKNDDNQTYFIGVLIFEHRRHLILNNLHYS